MDFGNSKTSFVPHSEFTEKCSVFVKQVKKMPFFDNLHIDNEVQDCHKVKSGNHECDTTFC